MSHFINIVWFHCRGIFLYSKVIYYTRRYKREKKTVPDIFQLTVSKYPQKAAIIFEQKTWTFQEVEDYSNRIANYFKALGYQKGDCVAVILESSPEFVCAWLGLSKLGVVTAQINTNLRLDSLWHCISVANVKAIIFGSNFSGKKILAKIITIQFSLQPSPPFDYPKGWKVTHKLH